MVKPVETGMAWKKRVPVKILMDAQVWMSGEEIELFCLDRVLGAGTSPVCRMLLSPGEGDNLQPFLHAEGISSSMSLGAGSWEHIPHSPPWAQGMSRGSTTYSQGRNYTPKHRFLA